MDNKNEQSPEATLCILKDGEGKPMHIRVIGNAPTEYRDLCRDYAAFALLKQTRSALNSTVEKYRFRNASDLPDIRPENYEYVMKYAAQQEKLDKVKYSISDNLKGYIADFLCKTPVDDLIFSPQLADREVNDDEMFQK